MNEIAKDKASMFLEAMINSTGSQSKMRLVPNTKENLKLARQIAQVVFDAEPDSVSVRYRKGTRSKGTMMQDVLKSGAKAFDVYCTSKTEVEQRKSIDEAYRARRQAEREHIECTKQCSRLENNISRLEESILSLKHQVESRDAEIAQYEQHIQTQKDESAEANRVASKWIANKKVFKALLQDKLDELSDF